MRTCFDRSFHRALWTERTGFSLALGMSLLPFAGDWLVRTTGLAVFQFTTPFVVFVLIGFLDHLLGEDRGNPSRKVAARLAADPWLGLLPLVALPAVAGCIAWGAWWASEPARSTVSVWAMVLSVGTVSGALGITAAHELIHRAARSERIAGCVLLALVCYGTFRVEHVRGHHVDVATPRDRSSARRGQSVYDFLPRAIAGNVVAAWRLEADRLAREGRPALDRRNVVLVLSLASLVTLLGFWALRGPLAALFFLGQSLVAITLLEIVNYMEHYGLRRARLPDGRFERVTVRHSWNAPFRLSNLFLFNLQRHSDHHAAPGRRFAVLQHHDDSPQLPAGYASLVLLALVPPLWFFVMNRRLDRYYGSRDRVIPADAPRTSSA